MVFNSKGKFFLNLDEKGTATPVTVAPVAKPAPKAEAKPKAAAPVSIQAASGAPATASTISAAPEATTAPQGQALTTAEAIAAELAAAQAARPVVVDSTFAPDCLTPGGALPMRRRRGGANLAGFRAMAGGLFGKT
jgi:hypothetical protein